MIQAWNLRLFITILKNFQKIWRGVKVTALHADPSFEFWAFEYLKKCRDGSIKRGYNWCGGVARWGTSGKTSTIRRYYKQQYGDETIVEYIGIAADEEKRIVRARQKKRPAVSIFPLVEWGMTEADCLEYCRENGWDWLENGVDLYDILDRVSCWCCSNKNQKEIKNIMQYLPEYWDRIKVYEQRCGSPYKGKGCAYFEEKLK